MTHAYEIFIPFYIFSKITGFSPFTMKNNQVALRSRQNFVQTVLFAVINLYCIFLLFKEKIYFVPLGEEIKTIVFILAFRLYNSVANVLLTTFVLFIKSKSFLLVFQKIVKLDKKFNSSNLRQYIQKSNNSLKKTLIFLYIFFQIVVNIFCFSMSLFGKLTTSPRDSLIAFCAIVFPRLIATNMNLTFCAVLMLLKERLKAINVVLLRKAKDSRLLAHYPQEHNFARQLNYLCFLHKKIVEISQSLNSIYYVHLLLWISVSFLLFTGDLYLIVHLSLFNPYANFSTVFVCGKYVIIYVSDLALLVKCAADICHEANCTRKILVTIKIDVHKEEAQDSVSF